MSARSPQPSDALSGGGEMGALARSVDWSRTLLGPVSGWPQSLKTSVSICLNSRFPMLVFWGPRQVMIYNDAYRPILGAKHPRSMGQEGPECWSEIWDVIGPMLEGVRSKGEATWSDDLHLPINRNGFPEECYFTFSYSPIWDETGSVGGILTTVTETTRRVLSERRLKTLRELAARGMEAQSAEVACEAIARTLGGNSRDIPFAALYLLDPDEARARLAAAANLPEGHLASPVLIPLDLPTQAGQWPLREALSLGSSLTLDDLGAFPILPGGPWPERPQRAMVLPIASTRQEKPAGFLIAGISPRLSLDEEYRGFLGLVAGHAATAVKNARAHEEEKRRAEALMELDRAKTAFFSNISHEFRTPLTLMLGPAEELLADADRDPAIREKADLLHRNSLRLMKLVNSLLDFSRIEAGRVQAAYAPTDLAAFTAELAGSFRSAMEKAGLALDVDCPALPEPVYVDRDMWEKIVLNLLSNAFKFTFEGRVTVRVRALGRVAELLVQDTGVGIAPEEMPRLFERFHRIRNTRARSLEGSGIGLALVRELVHLQGGSIRAESRPGKGTAFMVTVPLGKAHLPEEKVKLPDADTPRSLGSAPFLGEALRWLPEPAATDAGKPPPAQGIPSRRPGRILLVDDNADMCRHLARILSPYWRVETCRDGLSALEAVRIAVPDLILSDVMMPGLDGFGLLSRLKADPLTAAIPVILLSARAGEEATVEGMQAGADDYLVKPFSARELLARVGARIEIAHLRKRRVERDRELQALFREAPALICVLRGPENVYEFANPAYHRVMGDRDLIGRPIREFFPMPEAQVLLDIMEEIKRTGVSYQGREFPFTMDWGAGIPEEKFFDFVYQAARNEQGEIDGIAMFGFEVTALVLARRKAEKALEELKETQEHLRQTQKMEAVGKLAGGIAHDFNNLLTAINGYAELALESARDPENLEYLQEIRKSGERAATLTRQLLAFSRKQVLAPRTVNLNSVIGEMEPMLRRLIGEDIELRVRRDDALGLVRVDPGQVGQILLNLVLNARDAMPQGGVLTLSTGNVILDEAFIATHSTATPGPHAVLEVEDTGVGMSGEILGQIFEPFFTTKPVGQGTGLGLSSVYGFVKQSDGSISVQSRPGAGTTFRIYLPIQTAEPPPSRTPLPETTAAAAAQGRILLVEDEEGVRKFIRSILSQRGYEVIEAADGDEAYREALAEPRPIHLLLTDVVMPRMGGPRLAAQLEAIHPETLVLYMSGYPGTEVLGIPEDGPGSGFLQKPFSTRQLLERIEALLQAGSAAPRFSEPA